MPRIRSASQADRLQTISESFAEGLPKPFAKPFRNRFPKVANMLKTLIVMALILLVSGCASMVPVSTPATPNGRCAEGRDFGWRAQAAEIPKAVAKLFSAIQVPTPTLHSGATVQDHWFRTNARTYTLCRDTDMPKGKTLTGDIVTVTITFKQRNSGWQASPAESMQIMY